MRRWRALGLAGLLLPACVGSDAVADDPAPLWPAWAFGHWVWEDEGTQDSALQLVRDYQARGIAVDALIVDSPWATGYSTFQFDPALYPDPAGMIAELHLRSVRLMLWTVSAINRDQTELYGSFAARGWFMKARAGASGPGVVNWWKGDGALLDYFNPEAVDAWHALIEPVLDLGIDGWKTDGTDFYQLYAPHSPSLGRNAERAEYSDAYYRDFFDLTRARLGDDRIITGRPVDNYGLGIGGDLVAFAPRDLNWAGWVGDQDGTFAGLRAALDNMYYSAELGYVGFGSDIGGYREDDTAGPLGRTTELFVRWTQLAAFCPVMENGGGGEHRPWVFEPDATEIYRRFVELHRRLVPYLMREGAVAWGRGESLLRFVDRETYAFELGPDVFVVPVLADGVRRLEVELPRGRWLPLFGPPTLLPGGPLLSVEVPLDAYPAFVRDGSRVADELLGE